MRSWHVLLAVAAAGLGGMGGAGGYPTNSPAAAFTVAATDHTAYSQPASVLSERQLEAFQRGRAAFDRPWVVFGDSGGDWGVGPTFVADRCSTCHALAGRGLPPPSPQSQLQAMVVRVSAPGTDARGGPKPLENYGDQLQNNALQGQRTQLRFAYQPVPAEAALYVDWNEHRVTLRDGTEVGLRSPRLKIESLAFGELPAHTLTSLRIASPVFGVGLLEAVPESALLALALKQRALGFNGRPNIVWDVANARTAIGRFGWKANQPHVRQQIATAALGDMGVTSSLFPKQNCPPVQVVCAREVPGNDPELSDVALDDLELMALGLAVPAPRNVDDAAVKRGGALFAQLQCAVCHVPSLRTMDYFPRVPQLSKQTIEPYTDLLLHDMGEGLADGRPDFAAGGRDWRTPPLWGLGLSKRVNGSDVLLHDGRARNVTEAILWHGGEAQRSRDGFADLPKADREAIVAFVNSI